MTVILRSDMAQATPGFSGVEVANSTDSLSADRSIILRRLADPEGGVLTDIGISNPLAKAIGARRETQRYLERLIRQIVSRAGRQATTVKTRSRNVEDPALVFTIRSSSTALPSSGGPNSTS